MTLKEVYELWVPIKNRQVKRSTLSCYRLIFIKILLPKIGEEEISLISRKNIMPLMYELLDEGKSVKYCGDILIALRMVLRFASDELDIIIPDTRWKMKWPTSSQTVAKKVERYSTQDFKKIVDCALLNPSPCNLGILLTICSGMRIGEICALKWSDIDLESKTIHVCKTMERIYDPEFGKTSVEIGTPKSTSSDRYIPILKSIYAIVKKFYAVSIPDYYVLTCTEKYIEPRTYRNHYRDFIEKKVGIDSIKFHGLRHTFASTLIERKIDVKTVSTILGHSDISTTLNVYVHPSSEAKRDAVNAGLSNIFK